MQVLKCIKSVKTSIMGFLGALCLKQHPKQFHSSEDDTTSQYSAVGVESSL